MSAINVFISYSHKDKEFRDELEVHIKPLVRNGEINAWVDNQILPGEKWDDKIKEGLEEAQVIIFLVSPDFLASDYIYGIEIKRAIEKQESDSVVVVPILIREVDFSNSILKNYQALPEAAKPVKSWDDRDAAWVDVARKLKLLFNSIKSGKTVLKNSPSNSNSSSSSLTDSNNENPNGQESNSNDNIDFAQLKTWVAKGKTKKALDEVITLSKDTDVHNTAILLSSRLSSLLKSERSGLISAAESNVSNAKITHALLSLIEDLEEELNS